MSLRREIFLDIYHETVQILGNMLEKHYKDLPFPAFGKFFSLFTLHTDNKFINENPRLKDQFKAVKETAEKLEADFVKLEKPIRKEFK